MCQIYIYDLNNQMHLHLYSYGWNASQTFLEALNVLYREFTPGNFLQSVS